LILGESVSFNELTLFDGLGIGSFRLFVRRNLIFLRSSFVIGWISKNFADLQ